MLQPTLFYHLPDEFNSYCWQVQEKICLLVVRLDCFSLSRITAASLYDEKFTIPSIFDFRQITGIRFGVHWGRDARVIELEKLVFELQKEIRAMSLGYPG
jgi:hypothetical protein